MRLLVHALAVLFDLALLAVQRLFGAGRRQVAGRRRAQGAGGRVFGFGRQRLAGVAEAGDRRFGRGEAAADAGVVDVGGAGVGGDEGSVGEEEGVRAVGGGVEEGGAAVGPSAGDQADAAVGPGAAARAGRLPLVDVLIVVGVLGDERVGAVEEEALGVGREDAGLVGVREVGADSVGAGAGQARRADRPFPGGVAGGADQRASPAPRRARCRGRPRRGRGCRRSSVPPRRRRRGAGRRR